MKFGLFGMNVTGGLVMTKNPQWKPTLEKIAERLQMVEKSLPCRLARSFDRCFNGDSPQVMPKKRMSARIGTLIIKGVMAATVSESVKVKRLLTG